jgi:hypothetical protein
MASLGGVFGEGSTARQLLVWQVLAQVIGALAAPGFTELTKLSNSATPVMPLDPGLAASAVARGLADHGAMAAQARDSGFNGELFDVMAKLAARAPDLSAAFEAHRRKLIPDGPADGEAVSLRGALADAGIPERWHDALAELAISIPTQAEVLNAWLEGQIPEGEARHRLLQAGMDPSWIDSAYNANGQAPTPTQALELANRGIIPWEGEGPHAVTFRQAFLEGPWRNKWEPVFRALGEYLPPPRTITAMYHAGSLDHGRAAELLSKQGLAPDLVEAYLAKAASTKTATEHHLAKSEVTAAYADGIMTKAEALKALAALRYSEHDARLVLQLVDLRVKTAQLTQGTTRVRTLYQAGKLTTAEAEHLLGQLGVDATQAKAAVAAWHLTVQHTTRTLSPGQIEAAVYYELLSAADGIGMLRQLGYDEADAWLSIAIRLHGATGLPPRPPSLPPAPKRSTP